MSETKSDLYIVDEFEIFLMSHKTNLPVVVIKFVGSSSLKDSINLSLFALEVLSFEQASDLGPLLLR